MRDLARTHLCNEDDDNDNNLIEKQHENIDDSGESSSDNDCQ